MLRKATLSLVFTVWFATVLSGFIWLAIYSATPGAAAPNANDWPCESQAPPRNNLPTLLLFAHPQCPCTQASITELAKAVKDFYQAMNVILVVSETEPLATPSSGVMAEELGKRFPKARVFIDVNGVEARRFGATTSGHTFVYSADDRRLFCGGITGARGHLGSNPGRRTITDIRNGREPIAVTPIYGCPLFDENSLQK